MRRFHSLPMPSEECLRRRNRAGRPAQRPRRRNDAGVRRSRKALSSEETPQLTQVKGSLLAAPLLPPALATLAGHRLLPNVDAPGSLLFLRRTGVHGDDNLSDCVVLR